MGRRGTRYKIETAVELSRHLLPLASLHRPFSSEALFGRSADLAVEVGSGKGLFLARAAAEQPAVDFLGIEAAASYARLAALRLATAGVSNARVVCGDARRFFIELLPDRSCLAVHIYFPDPWWKKRHHKRRIMDEPFLRDVERTLKPGGSLHFWTDVESYFHAALETIHRATHLEGPLPVAERQAEHDMDYHTHFERRMRLAGKPVYRASFRRTDRIAAGEVAVGSRC
jgi:tRNA (guanine-N7-)-methyltransferase